MLITIFNDSKYTKWYNDIIGRAQNRSIDGYCETHHIIPVCIGGTDDNSNLVKLLAREHFICHLLLTKMHTSSKLKYAIIAMTLKNPRQKQRYIPTSRIYAYIKELNSQEASKRFKGKQKHNVGKQAYYDPITLEAKMFKNLDDVPIGWIKGSSPKRRQNQRGKNSGKIYYHNITNGDIIAISPNEVAPKGYVKGNPNAATAPSSGTKMYYNPKTFETKRFGKDDIVPGDWIKGSPYCWINNGNMNKQHLKNDSIPNGWIIGRLKWR